MAVAPGVPMRFAAEQISKTVADAEAQAELEELRGLAGTTSKQKQRASLAARRRSKVRPLPQVQRQQHTDEGEQVKI